MDGVSTGLFPFGGPSGRAMFSCIRFGFCFERDLLSLNLGPPWCCPWRQRGCRGWRVGAGMSSAGGIGVVSIEKLCYSYSPLVPSGEHLQSPRSLPPTPAQCMTGPQFKHHLVLTGFKSLHFPSSFLLQWGLFPHSASFPCSSPAQTRQETYFQCIN